MQIFVCNVSLKAGSSTTFTHGTQALPNQQQTWNATLGWNVVPENTHCLKWNSLLFLKNTSMTMSDPPFIIIILNPKHRKTKYLIRYFCKGPLRNHIQEKQDQCRKRMNE